MFLLYLPGYLFCLSFHEAAHAWMANRLGDATARLRGRMTLNPIPHIDILGTLVMPAIGFLTSLPVIAWAKPVPFDTRNLQNVRRDTMLIALAGPVSNLFLAFVFAFVLRNFESMIPHLQKIFSDNVIGMLLGSLQLVFFLNLALFLFNFLPLDPLDGGKIIRGVLPHAMSASFDMFMRRNQQVITWIFLILILSGFFWKIFGPILFFLARLFLGSDTF